MNKRLRILSESEIKDISSLPKFNLNERLQYFTIDKTEHATMEERRSIEGKIHFILQLGYFKHTHCFFSFTWTEVKKDAQYVLTKYFQGKEFPQFKITPKIQRITQSTVLKLLKFKPFDNTAKQKLEEVAREKIKICTDPRYIFDALLHYLDTQKITLPGYSTLQDIIGQSFVDAEARLELIIARYIPKYVDDILRQFLERDDEIYGITVFKTDAKGFTYNEVKAEIEKKCSSEEVYDFAAKILPKLNLSMDNIMYYSSLVNYYSVDKLRELSYEKTRLYLLCYTFYRFQRINDNLVHAFVYYVNLYKKKAKEAGKQGVYDHKTYDSGYCEKALELIDLFVDKTIKGITFFEKVREKAFSIVKEEDFPALKQSLKGKVIDEDKFVWSHYHQIAGLTTRNLRPLIRAINFESKKPNDGLIAALTFLQKAFDQKKSLKKIKQESFPTDFIPSSMEAYLYDVDEKDASIKTLNVHKYEFFVYEQLEKALSSERIVVNNSTSFKEFELDVMSKKMWEKKKGQILKDLANPLLRTPITTQLLMYRKELNTLLLEVNKEIASGKNKDIKIKNNGKWSLAYSGQKNEIDNPFYGQLPQISLIHLLHFVNDHCNFMDGFSHIKPRYAKGEADKDGIYACLMGIATNHSIDILSQISDLNYDRLHSIFKSYFRLENLKGAADIVSDHLSELPIFKEWNLMDNLLFASLDGKKRQTKRKNIIARFSPKYFGRKRGVVSYSMIANNVCINTKILGANEHESHYLFDMIQKNRTNIKVDYICGDDHSINSVNYVLSRLLSNKFGPHLKNLYKKAQKIFCFGNPEKYKDEILTPSGSIKPKLIEDEWDNLQHIFASLLMKETTQSIVVKKLSSSKRSSKTQKAMWEFDKIFRSLHILRFIQDPVLRQCIRIALNRGEGFHQLTGALGDVGGGKFKGSTELEIQIANECIRLVTNCIIYYNTLILSKIYDAQEKARNTKSLEFIKRLSPIAWRHINLGGNYEFTNQSHIINLDEMIANLDFDVPVK